MLHSLEIDLTQNANSVSNSNEQEQTSIHFSKKILEFLKSKISAHNSFEGAKKTNINELRAIFCDGFDNCSKDQNLLYGIANVNAFLKVKLEGFEKKYFDKNLNLKITEEDLKASEVQAEENGLGDFPFSNLEDLYINEDYTTSFDYYV